jgi:hypothetical protein
MVRYEFLPSPTPLSNLSHTSLTLLSPLTEPTVKVSHTSPTILPNLSHTSLYLN